MNRSCPDRLAVSLVVSGLMQGGEYPGVILFALGAHWNCTDSPRRWALITFCFASIFFALESNDQLRSVFSRETLESHRLIHMCGWSLLAMFLFTVLDFMHKIFATTDLTIVQWIICIVFGSLVLWASEIEKFFRRRAAASSVARARNGTCRSGRGLIRKGDLDGRPLVGKGA